MLFFASYIITRYANIKTNKDHIRTNTLFLQRNSTPKHPNYSKRSCRSNRPKLTDDLQKDARSSKTTKHSHLIMNSTAFYPKISRQVVRSSRNRWGDFHRTKLSLIVLSGMLEIHETDLKYYKI